MDIRTRIEQLNRVQQLVVNQDIDKKVCFTSDRQLAHGCLELSDLKCSNSIKTKFVQVYIQTDHLIIYPPLLFKKLSGSNQIETYILKSKNTSTGDSFVLRFDAITKSNSWRYTNASFSHVLLDKLVSNSITPHISLLYFSVIMNKSQVAQTLDIPNDKRWMKHYNVQCLEFAGIRTAERFVINWLLHTKSKKNNVSKSKMTMHKAFVRLIFQIVYTLSAIHNAYPNFRHNDLHLENIMMCRKISNRKSVFYVVSDEAVFKVPSSVKDVPQIIDFEWVSMHGEQNVIKVNEYSKPNAYVDLNKFLNHFYSLIFNEQNLIHPKMWSFLDRVVPKRYRIGQKGIFSIADVNSRWMVKPEGTHDVGVEPVEYMTPNDVLQDPIFDFMKVNEVGKNSIVFRLQEKTQHYGKKDE